MLFLPGAAPLSLPSNTFLDGHEGSSRVGQKVRAGSKITQLKGPHIIGAGD